MPLLTRRLDDIQPISANTQPTTSANLLNPIKEINGTKHKVTAINPENFLPDNNEYSLAEITKLLTPATDDDPVAKHLLIPLTTRVVQTVEGIKPFEHVFPTKTHKKTAMYIYDILENKIDCRSRHKIAQKSLETVKLDRQATSKVTFLNPRINSKAVFCNYIKLLDPHRLYFTKDDIAYFQKHEDNFLNYIQTGKLELGFEMFSRAIDRLLHRRAFMLLELKKGIDNNKLTTNEIIDFDRKEAPWLENSEQEEYWTNYLYKDIMFLQLDGYDNIDIVHILKERYKDKALQVASFQANDAFEYLINSMTGLEYRGRYKPPQLYNPYNKLLNAENIDNGMKTEEHRYGFKITKIYPNSLATKSESLKENQVIKSIAFNNSKIFNNTTNMHYLGLGDAYLRGYKSVKLEVIADVLEPDKTFICELTLKEEVTPETKVSSEIIEISHERSNTKYKIGVIKVPYFYRDKTKEGKLNTVSEDITSIINKLDLSETSNGLIIDLRNNLGGYITEFLKLIPIFLENYYTYKAECIGENKLESKLQKHTFHPKTTYNKPIICLVNNNTASASEILASAIQVFQRGLIVGENTFGKAVGENIIDVGYGTLKRVTSTLHNAMGKSHNLIGIKPDVFIPNIKSSKDKNETLTPHSKTFDDIIVSEPFTVEKFPIDLEAF